MKFWTAVFLFFPLLLSSQNSHQFVVDRFRNGDKVSTELFRNDILLSRTTYHSTISGQQIIIEKIIYDHGQLSEIEISLNSLPMSSWKYYYSKEHLLDSALLFTDNLLTTSIFYIYDNQGLLIEQRSHNSLILNVEYYSYNEKNLLQKKDCFEGQNANLDRTRIELFYYDSLNRLISTEIKMSDGMVEKTAFFYDVDGRMESQKYWINDKQIREIRYVYHGNHRHPTNEYEINPDGYIVRSKKMKYNSKGQLLKMVSKDYRWWGFESEKNKKDIEKFRYVECREE